MQYFRCRKCNRERTRGNLAKSQKAKETRNRIQTAWRKRNQKILTIRQRRFLWAHAKVHRAIKKGLLIRPKLCSQCGRTGKVEGHHEDYSNPLDVKWLCRTCHAITWRINEDRKVLTH